MGGHHTTITQQAWQTQVGKHPEYGRCPKFNILDALNAANVATDDPPDRDDNRQHYCRALREDINAARNAYTEFLAGSLTEYEETLEHGTPHLCDAALARLGHMLHSWQDYYAHSIDNNSPFRGNPGPIQGDPDNPSTNQKPASWGSFFNWGEHGSNEPGTRETDGGANRRAQAQAFSESKLEALFGKWWTKCHCDKCGQ